jgi:hypothetical protein
MGSVWTHTSPLVNEEDPCDAMGSVWTHTWPLVNEEDPCDAMGSVWTHTWPLVNEEDLCDAKRMLVITALGALQCQTYNTETQNDYSTPASTVSQASVSYPDSEFFLLIRER